MTPIRDTLDEMIQSHGLKSESALAWDMSPIAFSKIRVAEEYVGDIIVTYPATRPLCLGIPVNIVAPRKYMASEIKLGDSPVVTL